MRSQTATSRCTGAAKFAGAWGLGGNGGMAVGLPVIATNWGGPMDYIDSTSGILVEPASKEGFVKGLTDAMLKLSQSPELRQSMGRAGWERVREHFDWERKVDRILEFIHKPSTLTRSIKEQQH